MQSKMNKGFTIIELAISMTIITLIYISSVQLIEQVVIASDRNEEVMKEQWHLFELKNIITEDLQNIVNRSIRDELGSRQNALLVNFRDIELQFTRAGLPVFSQKKTSLLRVAYDFEDGVLNRLYWKNLDRVEAEEPIITEIANDIEEFKIQYYSKSYGAYRDNWKPTSNSALPELIKVTITSASQTIEFTIPILKYNV